MGKFVFSLEYVLKTCRRKKLFVDVELISKKFSEARTLKEFCNTLVDDLLHPDHEKLAVILLMQDHHDKMECGDFDEFYATMEKLRYSKVVSSKFLDKLTDKPDAVTIISHKNDYNFTYQAVIRLLKGYLCKIENNVIECPQYMWLRVAYQLHSNKSLINQTFNLLSDQAIIHASPTLFNSGTRSAQLSSCFLVCLKDDSVTGIYKTLSECADISKHGGGIGIALSNLRSKYSIIESSQNPCKGVLPVLEDFEHCARYVDQGGRRLGAICVYFEMSHPEIPDILTQKCERKLLDLFLALWIPDLFMVRVQEDGLWSFFDKQQQATLTGLYGDEYVKQYCRFEEDESYVGERVKARDLFNLILKTQIETGQPFITYKDTANLLSNQKNAGIIRSSNLCTEIYEISSPTETAVCNLASINLEKCVTDDNNVDYDRIAELTKILTQNLNKTIDNNFYCSEDAKRSNLSMRPIGIGVTGLQGLFFQLKLPFTSPEARRINAHIFELIYFSALSESNSIAKSKTNWLIKSLRNVPLVRDSIKRYTGCYSKFWGSPLSEGKTQIELYEELTKRIVKRHIDASEWESLMDNIKTYGTANSLLIALMPTVSTAEIVNATDCFEPIMGAIVSKTTHHGHFKLVNKHIRDMLQDKNVWNADTITSIIDHNGSVQQLDCLTVEEKAIYRTAWEIDPVDYISLAIDRAPFIDQGQSLSWFIEEPGKDLEYLGRLHFYTWENRLKTGMYYLRQLPVSQTTNFKKMDADLKSCVACS